ncbi:MAG: tetratricopeptide repeat protein [Candidatus Caenarcaniphilales bacterium]|nr:tetratricopeptide repeat protein [Candidatus Caenarcaniphilales bacterium]
MTISNIDAREHSNVTIFQDVRFDLNKDGDFEKFIKLLIKDAKLVSAIEQSLGVKLDKVQATVNGVDTSLNGAHGKLDALKTQLANLTNNISNNSQLKDKIKKLELEKEKLLKELAILKNEAGDEEVENLFKQAKISLKESRFDDYHLLLSQVDEYWKKKQQKAFLSLQKIKNRRAESLYLEAKDYYDRFLYSNALKKMKQAIDLAPGNIDYQFYRADIAYDSAKYNIVKNSMEVVLRRSNLDELSKVKAYNKLGWIYMYKWKNGLAVECFSKALDIYSKLADAPASVLAEIYRGVGLVYLNQGEHSLAMRYHKKALGILKTFNAYHPDVAKIHNNVGLIYTELGKFALAKESYGRSMDLLLKLYGAYHPHIAATYYKLGNVYSDEGKSILAIENCEKALDICLKVYDEPHQDIADTYYNLGNVYSNEGNSILAIENYEKALDIYLKVYDEPHQDIADTYYKLGNVYSDEGKSVLAIENYEKALDIDLQIHGEDHIYVTEKVNHLISCYKQTGQEDKINELRNKYGER